MEVSGTLVRPDGSRVTITIHPDGNTDEVEVEAGGRTAAAGGGGMVHAAVIQMAKLAIG